MFEDAQESDPETGWEHLAVHDDAPTVIDTLLRLDPDEIYTKTELSEETGVPLKTLYLDGTLSQLVDMGFLNEHSGEDEEARYSVTPETDVFAVAEQLDEAIQAQIGEI
jgi:Fe2+ or Zn2+ uptake regulation protein